MKATYFWSNVPAESFPLIIMSSLYLVQLIYTIYFNYVISNTTSINRLGTKQSRLSSIIQPTGASTGIVKKSQCALSGDPVWGGQRACLGQSPLLSWAFSWAGVAGKGDQRWERATPPTSSLLLSFHIVLSGQDCQGLKVPRETLDQESGHLDFIPNYWPREIKTFLNLDIFIKWYWTR